jgi:hypothetical protein
MSVVMLVAGVLMVCGLAVTVGLAWYTLAVAVEVRKHLEATQQLAARLGAGAHALAREAEKIHALGVRLKMWR